MGGDSAVMNNLIRRQSALMSVSNRFPPILLPEAVENEIYYMQEIFVPYKTLLSHLKNKCPHHTVSVTILVLEEHPSFTEQTFT